MKCIASICLSSRMSFSPVGTVSFISFSESEGLRLAGSDETANRLLFYLINFHIPDTDHAGPVTQLEVGGLFFSVLSSVPFRIKTHFQFNEISAMANRHHRAFTGKKTTSLTA